MMNEAPITTSDYDNFRIRVREHLGHEFGADGQLMSLHEWQEYRANNEPRLSTHQMREVVSEALRLLENLYVHMDLKRARRGVDPIRQLRVLADSVASGRLDTRSFHNRMLEIFKTLGDVHTAYRPSEPCASAIAFLPFLVNAYVDQQNRRKFVVTRVLWKTGEVECGAFDRNVEVLTWNGSPMELAVLRSAELEEGSNPHHDFALALQFMTVRWLGASFEPESPWVVVGYKDPVDGTVRECEFVWSVFFKAGGPRLLVSDQARAAIFGTVRPSQQTERSVHVASQVIHSWRKRLFVREAPDVRDDSQNMADVGEELVDRFVGYIDRNDMREFTKQHKDILGPTNDSIPSLLPLFLEARIHTGGELIDRGETSDGRVRLTDKERRLIKDKQFGYIGIRAFPLQHPESDLFKYELRRLLNLMPADGLIIDVRDNPGGSARNAEESLQFLSAKPIAPVPFRFIASELTRGLAQADTRFEGYRSSIETALVTGGAFSAGRPITLPIAANSAGQHYFGPVLLVTSATTYSAGDIFAAGFQDNEIGPILGVDDTTGAGGANCWFYTEDISPALGLRGLANGINMQIAVRQCTRAGDQNSGVPIEEVGIPVEPNNLYRLSRTDVVESRPWGLLLRAAQELIRQEASCDMETELRPGERDGVLTLTVRSRGITRLDIYEDGRPTTRDVEGPTSSYKLTSFPVNQRGNGNGRITLEIRGFADTTGRPNLVARYIQVFDPREEFARLRKRAAGQRLS